MSGRGTIRGHVAIARLDHWVKNVFVLPGIVIAVSINPGAIDWTVVIPIVIGFLSIGCSASSNYVINEILDAPFDIHHPVKRFRPVPSGLVNVNLAYVQWLLLLIAGLSLGYQVSRGFLFSMVALQVMGIFYNVRPFRTKDVPYLDVISESINNPIRLLAGWYIIDPPWVPSATLLLSYWMIGCYFMAIKRFAEIRELEKRDVPPAVYRKSLGYYDQRKLLVSIIFYAASAMLFFGAFLMRYRFELILSFPFIAFVMAVYLDLAFKDDSAVQAPEKLYREPILMFSTILCTIIMLVLFFVKMPSFSGLFAPTMPLTTTIVEDDAARDSRY